MKIHSQQITESYTENPHRANGNKHGISRIKGSPQLLETGETLSVATMEPHGVRADRAAFDAAGERLLSAPVGRRSLLLMDELGFLERCSPVFQRAVFTLLDGPTPVLGVLRPHEKSPFWGPVSRRADVRLLPLTVENRAEIPAELAHLLD